MKEYKPVNYQIDLGCIEVQVKITRGVHPLVLQLGGYVAGSEEAAFPKTYHTSVEYGGKEYKGEGFSETEALQNLSTKIKLAKELQ